MKAPEINTATNVIWPPPPNEAQDEAAQPPKNRPSWKSISSGIGGFIGGAVINSALWLAAMFEIGEIGSHKPSFMIAFTCGSVCWAIVAAVTFKLLPVYKSTRIGIVAGSSLAFAVWLVAWEFVLIMWSVHGIGVLTVT